MLFRSVGADRITKIGQVREIFNETLDVLRGGGRRSNVNFFERAMQVELIPFFLIGLDMPAEYNPQVNNFDAYWLRYVREGSNGFDNPDRLLQTVKENLWRLMEKAQVEANRLFAKRMVVDPLNLITEAMRGPGISPFQAFVEQQIGRAHV